MTGVEGTFVFSGTTAPLPLVWGKVIFSQVSVCPPRGPGLCPGGFFVGGVVSVQGVFVHGGSLSREIPWTETLSPLVR